MTSLVNTFLSDILPPLSSSESYFSLSLPQGKGAPWQDAASDIYTLAATAARASSLGRNAYFTLASFRDGSSRKQVNAASVKAFWADIDAGKPTSTYKDMREALAALVAFASATGLRPTYIVSSGRGLHVYWCLTRPIAADKWRGVAAYFHRLCKEQGLDVDPARAEDTASVLRVPGSLHQGSGNVVSILKNTGVFYDPKEFFKGVLETLKNTAPIAVAPAPTSATMVPESLAVAQGLIDAPTADAEKIVRNCPACLSAGYGPYPQWFAMMSIMRRCHNGREWAHRVSRMDRERYTPEDTDRKFDQTGYDSPTLCSTFGNICPDWCAKCRYRGLIKTPVQLTRLVESKVVEEEPRPALTPAPTPAPTPASVPAPAPVVESHDDTNLEPLAFIAASDMNLAVTRLTFPAPGAIPIAPLVSMNFIQNENGIFQIKQEQQPDGSFVTVQECITRATIQLRYCFYETEMDGLRAQRGYIFSVRPEGGVPTDCAFIIKQDMKTDGIMTWLYNNKANPANAYIKPGVFMAFFNAYLNAVGNTVPELRTYDKFGWEPYIDRETRETSMGFITGHGILTRTGFQPVNHGDLTAKDAYSTYVHKGSLAEWRKVPAMYRMLDQKAAELAMCMSFAGPLMPHGSGEAKNAIFSIWSPESGIGKSQLLRACASIWGDPSKQFFTRQDSIVARARKLSLLKNIPAFMDEMTDISDEDAFSLAYTLANGKEKQKLRSTGASFVATGDWSTTIITTANRSLKEAIARVAGDSDATLQRIMEFRCDFKSYADDPHTQSMINACMKTCQENYGLAGPEFLFQLLQRPERFDTLTARAESWFMKHNFANKERFIGYSLFLALQAGRWAREFGLIDFDMDELEEWAVRHFLEKNREETKQLMPDLVEAFREYVNEQVPGMLVVQRGEREPDEYDPGTAGVPDRYIVRFPAQSAKTISMRHEMENRTLYCSSSSFKKWCSARNFSVGVVCDALRERGVVIETTQMSLTKYVRSLPTARVRCMKISGDSLDILGFDDIVDAAIEHV